MNLGAIDFGNPEQERAAFFGALESLGGLGGESDLGSTSLVPNPIPYPPPGPNGVDFPDPKDPSYTYRANTDGSFRILTAPKGSTAAGKLVSSGSAFDAIKKVYLEWAASQATPGVAVERASGQTVAPKKKKKKDAKKAEATASTFSSIFKGVTEALPGFVSAAAAAGEAPPPEEEEKKPEGWGITQYALLAGGVVVAAGLGYLVYTRFSASSAVSAGIAKDSE